MFGAAIIRSWLEVFISVIQYLFGVLLYCFVFYVMVSVCRSQGCHYLHADKGTCETDPFLHNCRVFKSSSQVRLVPNTSAYALNHGIMYRCHPNFFHDLLPHIY